MTRPPVELFILHYNGGEIFKRTLRSLQAQTYPHCRIIISDNGSKPEFEADLKQMESSGLVVRRRRPGSGDCYGHYNLCIPEVTAPYVMFCHGDDLYSPDMVTQQVALLESHPELDAVLTGGNAIGSEDQVLWPIGFPPHLATPVLDPSATYREIVRHGNSFLIAPSALFRSRVFKSIGPLRSELIMCGDLEYWLRILHRGGGLGYLPGRLIGYRMSLGQGSAVFERTRTEVSEFPRFLEEYLKLHPVDPESRRAFDALYRLDQFQADLNVVAMGGSTERLQGSLRWFAEPLNRPFRRGFGIGDRLRLAMSAWAPRLESIGMARATARQVIQWTDPRTSFPLRWALRLKRGLMKSVKLLS